MKNFLQYCIEYHRRIDEIILILQGIFCVGMKVVISGASGYLGRNIQQYLEACGMETSVIPRKSYKWHIHDFKDLLFEADVLIHLTGSPIIKRWNQKNKVMLYKSRIDTTRKIYDAFTLIKERPRLVISVSAAGIYKADNGLYSEESIEYGDNFAASLVQDWEKELNRFNDLKNLRNIIFRLPVVLGKEAPAWKKLKFPFQIGLGGRLGNGAQAFPFLHIDDLLSAIRFAIEHPLSGGTFNLATPVQESNLSFAKKLGKEMKKPSFFIVPGFLLRLRFGQAADLLLKGAHINSQKIINQGFNFKFSDTKKAIANLLDKKAKR